MQICLFSVHYIYLLLYRIGVYSHSENTYNKFISS